MNERAAKAVKERIMAVIIYFDMDGVLAKWDTSASVEDTFQEGYFLKREEERAVADLIRKLKTDGYNVAILSAVYTEGTAYKDKENWLINHSLADIPNVFVPYGEDKFRYVDPTNRNILIDDFSRNLHAWEKAGFTGIKFLNGINGNHGTWTGYTIDHRMSIDHMSVIVKAVADAVESKVSA